MMCNIPSCNNDACYMYKMPCLITQRKGCGSNIKTQIVNLRDVALAIRRPSQYVLRWFRYELGAKTRYKNDEGKDVYYISGEHQTPVLQELLDHFIDAYVLCAWCTLPETDMSVGGGIIKGKCHLCGWYGQLDNVHKVALFINNHPPDPAVMRELLEDAHNVERAREMKCDTEIRREEVGERREGRENEIVSAGKKKSRMDGREAVEEEDEEIEEDAGNKRVAET